MFDIWGTIPGPVTLFAVVLFEKAVHGLTISTILPLAAPMLDSSKYFERRKPA